MDVNVFQTKLTIDNALTYLQQVEKFLSKDDFSSFLEIIEDFKCQRISTSAVVKKVKLIFTGKPPSLSKDFNMFLPPEYQIVAEDGHQDRYAAALRFVRKIRHRFTTTQPKILPVFIDVLAKFQKDSISVTDARARIEDLLKGESDLFSELGDFLPMPSNKSKFGTTVSEADLNAGSNSTIQSFSVRESSNCASKSQKIRGAGSETVTLNPELGYAGLCTLEKRKLSDRAMDRHTEISFEANRAVASDQHLNKRRLVGGSKGQNPAKDGCKDRQDWTPTHPHSFRRAQQPLRINLSSCKYPGKFSSRRFRLFQKDELTGVLPQTLIQKVHNSLKVIYSSGS